jgi:hypothetical protein
MEKKILPRRNKYIRGSYFFYSEALSFNNEALFGKKLAHSSIEIVE